MFNSPTEIIKQKRPLSEHQQILICEFHHESSVEKNFLAIGFYDAVDHDGDQVIGVYLSLFGFFGVVFPVEVDGINYFFFNVCQ